MKLKEKLKIISGYKNADFFNAKSIGVIGRGPSVFRLDLCYKKFDHCFLAGEFNHTLHRIKKYICNKQIVLCIMQHNRYRTTKENCCEFDIHNIQVRCQGGTKRYRKCMSKFPDLKVSGFTKKHYEIVNKINNKNSDINHSIFSTGIGGIVSALYFDPKEIHIIGLDFYNKNVKPYFIREDKDLSNARRIEQSIRGLRKGMIESINSICNNFRNINLYLYTTYRGVKSKDNLCVRYV